MTNEQRVNVDAAVSLVEKINDAERKLKMMKVLVNPEKGVLEDKKFIMQLFVSTNANMDSVRDLLIKFM